MKIIVGLGNPGEKYSSSRHNVGHLLVDMLSESNLKSYILAKTDSFMNESGGSVRKILSKHKTSLENLYIAHDDLDIPLGQFKIQFGKGPRVHNGVNSVEEELGTKDFWRIRIGVDNRVGEPHFAKAPRGKEYVLEDFSVEEVEILKNVFPKILNYLKND